MNRSKLPAIRLDARPSGLKFRAPASALAKWDRSIQAKAAQQPAEGTIDIMGEIGPTEYGYIGAEMVKGALNAIGKAPVLVTLNSPGGDAFEGIAIYNLLREHPGKITVNVLGLAASAASVIAMAGDKILIGDAAFLMIHSAWGIVMGNRNDMREFADVLDQLDTAVAELYARRSGLPVAEVIAMMEKETWMTGKTAVEKGFADTAVADEKKKAKAAVQTPIFASTHPALLAASGASARPVVRLSASPPGASGTPNEPAQAGFFTSPKGTGMQTIAEQVTSYSNQRAANAERMNAIMAKSADEGRTLDEPETQEYDELSGKVKSIDDHLVRLKEHEVRMVAKAVPITAEVGADPKTGSDVRANSGILFAGPNIQPGIRFARMAIAMHRARGDRNEAASIIQSNRRWMDQTPEVAKAVRMTAVPAADTTTAGWAAELVYANNIAEEFIEYLRPMTILGRLTGVRRVPFNVRMGSLTGGTTGYWVGQGKAIPMSKGTTGSLSLGMTKAAGLAAYDDEILKSSSPSIEEMVRNDLGKAVAQTIDVAFIDPNNGGVANEKPASILYNVTPTAASGTTAAFASTDVASVFAAAIAANMDPMSGVWVMTPTTALRLGMMQTSLGQAQYPGISITGGTWQGLPVIVSPNAFISGSPDFGNMIVLILQNEIILADDGDVDIEISNEASLEFLDNPTNLSTGATAPTTVVSLFQTQSWAIKAVRYCNWTKRRAAAAAFIRNPLYA